MHVLSKEGVMIQLRVCEIITKAYICALKVRVSISIIAVMSVSQQINGHVQKVNHVALGHGLAVFGQVFCCSVMCENKNLQNVQL
jgi:hypothetical protein